VATYAELHVHSGFSFLDGASDPEELVAEAHRLGLSGLGLTDHHGLYGVVRFAQAARAFDLRSVYGAELTFDGTDERVGVPDPSGTHLVVLARSPEGYRQLSVALAEGHLARGEKGVPRFTREVLAQRDWQVLTGCRKGSLTRALYEDGPRGARRALDELIDLVGRDRVAVELWDHGHPDDVGRNDALSAVALAAGAPGLPPRQRAGGHSRAAQSRRDGRMARGLTPGAPAQ
jgi:error-prone DNA polymerase